MNKNNSFDVAVVGGGPAGTSAARHAALLGLKTILFEKESYPRPKPCGGALSERCLPLLGDTAREAINSTVSELRLFAPSLRFFSKMQPSGYFILRDRFDAAMAADARNAGAMVMERARVSSVDIRPDGTYGIRLANSAGEFFSTCIVSAAGFPRKSVVHSPIAPEPQQPGYFAMTVVSETPAVQPFPDPARGDGPMLGIFFGAVPNGYGWFFMKDGYLNIGVGATAELLAKEGAVNAYRRFVKVLRELRYIPEGLELAPERAYPLPFRKTARQTVFGKTLLAGDSAGFVSPVTGEGLYYAIKSGQLAASAISEFLRSGAPLNLYQDMWLRDFGHDNNRYGYRLREIMYKSRGRMEFSVTLGRYDKEMATLLTRLILGETRYRTGAARILARLPLTLLKILITRLKGPSNAL